MKTIYVSEIQAVMIITLHSEGGVQPWVTTMEGLRQALCQNGWLLHTGAKCGYHPEAGWYVHGYAQDGSDVDLMEGPVVLTREQYKERHAPKRVRFPQPVRQVNPFMFSS